MKNHLILFSAFFTAMLMPVEADAVIANPEPATIIQPNGKSLTLQRHGDEFFSYTTTLEGMTVVYNPLSSSWEYARLASDGTLEATGVIADDGPAPSIATRHLKPLNSYSPNSLKKANRLRLSGKKFDYSKFKGLVILVEYNDAPFTRSDIHDIFDRMINQPDYDGYMSNTAIPSKIPCTGSVRDYYYENSNGLFNPSFDVYGPVKIDYSQHSARKSANAQNLVTAALRGLDQEIDYSVYDTDHNNEVDMVYFIFSGAGSNHSANPETLIWPHASIVMDLRLDGVSFGRYACSTELYGNASNKRLDGIGTICHEFSHVLGLPDLYDVDYETGGQAIHPAKWSIMASGSYLNKSVTPCGYSLYERYALGFAFPRLISSPGEYSIAPLNQGDSPDGCRINSSLPNEFFLLENRVKTGWDEYLPGEGMLVHRVDSTENAVWENNKVNANPNHTFYTLLRANPKKSGTTVTDSDGDPFPGSGNVTSLTNSTDPALRSWTSTSTPLVIENIAINQEGIVEIKIAEDEIPTLVEDFALMAPGSENSDSLPGRFSIWELSGGAKVEADSIGDHSVLTIKGSTLICHSFSGVAENCAVTIDNTSGSNAIFRLYASTDGMKTWLSLSTLEGTANPSIATGKKTIHYSLGNLSGAAFRLMQYTGSTTQPCHVGRIEFGMKKGTVSAVSEITVGSTESTEEAWYTLQGIRISRPTSPGIYILRQGTERKKIKI